MVQQNALPASVLDFMLARVATHTPLSRAELLDLVESPDLLAVGMLADAWRRKRHPSQVTYLRVATIDTKTVSGELVVPEAAREIRVEGTAPGTLASAVDLVSAVKAVAGARTLSAFAWADVEQWAAANGGHKAVLSALRSAGLDGLAAAALDVGDGLGRMLTTMADAGFANIRLVVNRPASVAERLQQFLSLADVAGDVPVVAVAPLPLAQPSLRPTTGYDDVKAVALARLALPQVAHVQIDWLRYGPKLAQVALTFGADDLDNVVATDEMPDGRRRSPLEELRRNVEAAGFVAVERSGRYAPTD